MELELARRYAKEIVDYVSPFCHRAEVAGGVRWGKAQPHDIELVVAPKLKSSQRTIEGEVCVTSTSCPGSQFGVIVAAGTGDAGFTQSIYGIARSKGMRFTDGCIVDSKGEHLQTPKREDMFRALGLPWVEPKNRSILPCL